MIILRRLIFFGLAVVISACQAVPTLVTPAVTLGATVPPASPTPPRPHPTLTVTPTAAPPATATAAPTARPLPPPRYTLAARVNLIAHTLTVTASIDLVPPAPGELVFNLNPLQQAQLTSMLAVTLDGAPIEPVVDGVWVRLPLADDWHARQPVQVEFAYELLLQPIDPWAWGWRGTLGHTPRQVNLGDWYPVLALYNASSGWVTPLPTALGEYVSTSASDYAVQLEVQGAVGPVTVVGSGGPQPCGGGWCTSLAGARFVAYVISESMLSQTITTSTGVAVTSVYLPEHAAAGEAALRAAANALETYSVLYGPYPFSSFVQVEGDFYDGMEYSGITFVGSGYYAEYDGTPNNLLTIISAHEAAHQWWHTLVGNDQAAEPWLDEAVATYSELAFLEAHHPGSVDWWWAFRVDWFAPQGPVDSTIYDYGNFRGYVDAVYLRGAQMLHAMRAALGDNAFWAFLRTYAASKRGQVATAADFWNAFAAAGGDVAAIRSAYFANP